LSLETFETINSEPKCVMYYLTFGFLNEFEIVLKTLCF